MGREPFVEHTLDAFHVAGGDRLQEPVERGHPFSLQHQPHRAGGEPLPLHLQRSPQPLHGFPRLCAGRGVLAKCHARGARQLWVRLGG